MDMQSTDYPGPLTFGRNIAQLFVDLPDHQWPQIVSELRATNELSKAIREINQLLLDPVHRDLAVAALRRVGLYLAV
jgi:hypothetical protein